MTGDPASATRAEVEQWIDKSENRLVCTAVLNTEIHLLNRILRRFRLPTLDDRSLLANVIATALLTALLYVLTVTITADLVQLGNYGISPFFLSACCPL